MRAGHLALRRTRWRARPLLVAGAVTLVATTVVAVVTAYLAVVGESGVRSALGDGADPRLVTTVTSRASGGDAAVVQGALDDVVTGTFGAAAPRSLALLSDSFGVDGRPETDLVELVAYERPAEIGRLTAGSWPEAAGPAAGDPVAAALPRVAAEELGLAVGDALTVRPRTGGGPPTAVRLVATYDPDPVAVAVGTDLERSGVTRTDFTTYGPVVVSPSAFAAATASARVTVRARVQPPAAEITPSRLRPLAASIERLDASVSQLPQLDDGAVLGSAPVLLRAVHEQLRAVRGEVVLPGAGMAALAGVALVVVASALSDGSRRDRSVLRARGASRGTLVRLAMVEAATIALPAAVLAPLLATALVSRFTGTSLGWPGLTTWAAALVAVGVCAAVLALPASRMPSLTEEDAATSRAPTHTAVAQVGVDLALLALAVGALWQLRSSTASGAAGDVGLVVAPGLGVLAGALLVPRLVALLARLVARAGARRRGLSPGLPAAELGRRPRSHAATAVLVATALGIATLGLAYDRSWTDTAEQQALQRTGADVRVLARPPELAFVAADVPEGAPVAREPVFLGGARTTLLVVDLDRYQPTAAARALLGPAAAELQAEGRSLPALASTAAVKAAGLRTASSVNTSVGGLPVDLRVAAVADRLPTVTTDEPVLLVDAKRLDEVMAVGRAAEVEQRIAEAERLGLVRTEEEVLAVEEQVLGEHDWQPPEPDELWLSSDDPPSLARVLRDGAPAGVVVEDRVSLVERLRDDPLTGAGRGAGRLALAAAAVLVLVGFAGQVLVSGLRRAPDLAVLRALGLRRTASVRGLAREQAALGAVAAVCGALVGAAVALVALPVLLRSALLVPGAVGTATGLPPVVVLPWARLSVVLLGTVVVLGVVALGAARAAQRTSVAAVLRQREER